jgi:Ca-activated chloride channel family protein
MIRSALSVAGVAAMLLAGSQPLAKLALVAGMPGLAASFLSDPGVRGVALYRAGDHAGADDAFRAAGRGSTYNRGLSLAVTGNLPLSRAYFDAVLFANPADSQARDNRNLVNSLIPPTVGGANAAGRIAVTAIAVPGGSPMDEIKRLGRQLDEGRRVADAEWLATLPDDPGEFLRLRLAAEHKQKLAMGLTAPEGGDPW